HAVRPVEHRPEQIGGTGQVRQRQGEEQVLSQSGRGRTGNVLVVHGAVLDRIVEDRRVRGQPCHRKIVDVAFQRAAVQQLAGDVVEPEALAEIVQLPGRGHRLTFWLETRVFSVAPIRARSRSSRSPMRSMVTSAGGKALITLASCAYWPWRGNTVVTRSPQTCLTASKMRSLSSTRT